MNISCTKPHSKTCKNKCKTMNKFLFVFLPSNSDTYMYSCILFAWKNGIPQNELFILWGRLSYPPKRIALAKACSSHCRNVNILGILLIILARLLRFLKESFSRKSLVNSKLQNIIAVYKRCPKKYCAPLMLLRWKSCTFNYLCFTQFH